MEEADAVGLLYEQTATERDLVAIIGDLGLDSEIREGALNHPGMTDERINSLATLSVAPIQRDWVLRSTSRPGVLRKWATSESQEERALVAFNPDTPADVALSLLHDPMAVVRAAAVFHPAAPLEAVRRLAVADESEGVRVNAADALTTSAGWSLRQGRRWVTVTDAETEAHEA